MSIVKVKRISRGLNWGAKGADGKILTKYNNCTDKYVPGLDKVTGVLQTGLSKADETKLEKELRLEKGTLAGSSRYWDNFVIVIPEEGLTLDTSIPDHELKYKVLSADPAVAKSLQEVKVKARAEYVMTSETAEAKEANTKRKIIANAYALYAKMTQDEVVNALYLLGKDSSTTDSEVARNVLGDIVEKTPAKFLETVGDSLFEEKVWFLKMIKAGILRKAGTGLGTKMPIYYHDMMLGSNLEEAIAFVKDKENQNIYIELKKESDKKKL